MNIRFDRQIILQTVGVATLLVFACGDSAMAQNADVNGRLSRIENEIQTLSRAMFRGETPPAGAFAATPAEMAAQAETQNRLSALEQDLRMLTGKVEEMTYELNRLKNLQQVQAQQPVPQQQYNNVQAPVAPGYPSVGMASTSVTQANPNFSMDDPNAAAPYDAPTAGQLGVISSQTDTPTAAYESAFVRLRAQDYAGAQSGFDAFIKAHPDHALVPNALYWLGETYYVRNDFVQATRIFAESYQKYPKGSKAPDSLLKLGMSLAAQGKTADACVALGQLKKEYPAGAAPVLTRGDQEMQKLNCR